MNPRNSFFSTKHPSDASILIEGAALPSEPQQGIVQRFGRNVFYKALAEILSRLVYLFFFLYLARAYGNEIFGLFSFAFSYASIVVILVDPGLNLFLTREIAADPGKGPQLSGVVLGIKIVLSCAALILSFLAALMLGYEADTIVVLTAMTVALVFNAIMDFHIAVFNGYERMEFDLVVKLTNKTLITAFGILSISAGASILEVTMVMAAATLLTNVLGSYLIGKQIFRERVTFDVRKSKDLLKASWPIALTMIFNALYLKIDVVLMSKLSVPTSEIGLYAAPARIIEILMFLPALVVAGAFPIFAQLARGTQERFSAATAKVQKLLFVCATPIVVSLFLQAEGIIAFLYGEQYTASTPALQILSWSLLCIFLNFHFSGIFVVLNRQRVNAVFSGVGVVFCIAANLYLIPRFGYIGASIATVCTHALLLILNVSTMMLTMGPGAFIRPIMKPALGGILMSASMMIPLNGVNWKLILGFLTYGAALVALKVVSKEDLSVVRELVLRKLK